MEIFKKYKDQYHEVKMIPTQVKAIAVISVVALVIALLALSLTTVPTRKVS